jgi:hypothetical protein
MQAPPIWGHPRGARLLTDSACRKAKPESRDRKIADAKGLFLLVKSSGAKLWRLKYRHAGKEKQLAFGGYPEISLEAARTKRAAARALLDAGIDPSIERKKSRALAHGRALASFRSIAEAWVKQQAATRDARYAGQVESRLRRDVFPSIGTLPIAEVSAPMVLALLRKVEARGANEMARRVRMHVSHVFDWAIGAGLAEVNPAARVGRALAPRDSKRRSAAIALPDAREVLERTEALPDAYWATRLASRLLALTAARPGNVRRAERAEFEELGGPDPRWRIPAAKLKLKRERKSDASYDLVIPLSVQAAATVRAAMEASEPLPSGPRWLFPGIGDRRKPISDSTLGQHYLDAGLRGRHVPHGWRASFSTIMNERAARENRDGDRAIIDMMLGHMAETVEAAYNRAAYMPRRREIAQAWADGLMEGLPPPDTLVPRAP